MTIHHCTLLNDDSWHWHFCVIMTRWRLKIQNPVNRDEAHGHKRSSTMKCLPPLALLTIVFLRLVPRVVANKWECDKRCGEKAFERCKKEQEENDDNRNLLDERYNYEHSELNSKNRFRGSTGKKTRQTGDILDFQIKMFWKAGFCWQEEWRERKWCWTCWGDYPHCDEGDKVEIKWCDDNNDAQRWVYKPVSEQYGRFSPSMNQTLCFELVKNSKTKLRLLPCDEDNDRQLFSGWKPGPKFELKPHGQKERCISQEHDPKAFEELIAEECDRARGDHTNYWGLIDYTPSGYLAPAFNDMRSEDSCVIDLDLMNSIPIMSGTPFQSPDYPNIYLEQKSNGNLVVRDGATVVWESGANKKNGTYFTKLQGDGNMLTYRGKPGEDEDGHTRIWSSGSSDISPQAYFFGLDCGGEYVAIFSGTPNDIDDMIWRDNTLLPSGSTLSDPGEALARMTPKPSPVPTAPPSRKPTQNPTSRPTAIPPSTSLVQTTPEPFCKPYFLGLRRMESIREDWVFHSPDDDTLLLEQWNTANLAVRDGNRIIWESQRYNTTGEWYSILQSDGDLTTFPGVPDSPTGVIIWESNSTTIRSDFFLGVDCERKYVAIFGGSPESPDGSIIWKSPTYVW